MKSVASTDRADYPEEMYEQLGDLCYDRWYSAINEGKTQREAFKEIVHVIIDTYRETLSS